jgi:hypothetical protein
MNRKQFLINEIANLVLSRLNEESDMGQDKRVWEFVGTGNYSDYHGYDNGLQVVLGNEMSEKDFDEFLDLEKSNLDPTDIPGVEIYNMNVYGGSRQVHGIVFASNETEAQSLIEEYANTFPVTEYEGD